MGLAGTCETRRCVRRVCLPPSAPHPSVLSCLFIRLYKSSSSLSFRRAFLNSSYLISSPLCVILYFLMYFDVFFLRDWLSLLFYSLVLLHLCAFIMIFIYTLTFNESTVHISSFCNFTSLFFLHSPNFVSFVLFCMSDIEQSVRPPGSN